MWKFLKTLKSKVELFVYGLSGAEKAIMGNSDTLGEGTQISQSQEDQRVSKALLKGEVTQAVEELRYRTYKVTEESDKYTYLSNGVGVKKEKNKKREDGKYNFTIQNKPLTSGVLDELNRVGQYDNERFTIELQTEYLTRFKMEKYITYVDVDIKEDNYLTTLHFSKFPNVYDPNSMPFINELDAVTLIPLESEYALSRNEIASSLTNLSFTCIKVENEDDFTNYSFVAPVKLVEVKKTDTEFLLTFKWNGYYRMPLNLTQKYYSKEMNEKYQNKERRNTEISTVVTKRVYHCSVCGKEVNTYDGDIMSYDNGIVICDECSKKTLE